MLTKLYNHSLYASYFVVKTWYHINHKMYIFFTTALNLKKKYHNTHILLLRPFYVSYMPNVHKKVAGF
ncbi:hypothetical protein Hanom_Chr01g00075821 [Helianthus anomalus]